MHHHSLHYNYHYHCYYYCHYFELCCCIHHHIHCQVKFHHFLESFVIAKVNKNGFAYIDETRRGSAFTNLAEGADVSSFLTYAAERMKGRP